MSIVRLDKVKAAYNGNLESIKYTADLLNGGIWLLGNLATGEREVHDVDPITEAEFEGVDPFVLHATPEVEYDAQKSKLADSVVEAGKVGRAYHLSVGDVITVTADMFDSAPDATNKYVVPSNVNSGQWLPTADGTISITTGSGTTATTTVYDSKLVLLYLESDELGYAHLSSGNSVQSAYAMKVVKCN
jgi:hypothetical protein